MVNALGVAEDAEAGALGADAEARPANLESAIAEMGASPAGTGKGGDGRCKGPWATELVGNQGVGRGARARRSRDR